MIKALLIIRLKQVYRSVIGIGLLRILFLIAMVAAFGIALYVKSADVIISKYISTGLLFLILLIQVKREDKLFLKTHFSRYKILMLAEYFVLSVPVIICFLIHRQWIALSLLVVLLIIPNVDLKAKHSNLNTKLQKLIPSDFIEWKSGVRKYFFIIVPVWIIAVFTSFFVGSVPIAIFVLGILIPGFFEKCEPYPILLSYELSAPELLILKAKRQIQLFSVIILPLIVLFILFNIDRWYIPLAEYLIFCSLHIYAIMTKYAFYEPNMKSPAAQTFVSIGAVGSIIPVFLPVIWILTVWFYVKSINNLNFYLDDYNK